MTRRVVLVLIDGLSADTFAGSAMRMPQLTRMAREGHLVERVAAPTCGSSIPGRVSVVTGQPSRLNGAWSNYLFDGDEFRSANPGDIRVPTIAAQAREAGRTTACIGYITIDPADVDLYVPGLWIKGWAQRDGAARGGMHPGWGQTLEVYDPDGRLERLFPSSFPLDTVGDGPGAASVLRALECEQRLTRMAGLVAIAPEAPDLVLTEIELPDSAQHSHGHGGQEAAGALAFVDGLIGDLRSTLEGQDDVTVVVTSDHGHGPVHTAFDPAGLLPDVECFQDGAVLHVVHDGPDQLEEIRRRLGEFDVRPQSNSYIPEDLRSRVASFVAPAGHSFEQAAPGDAPAVRRTPRQSSTHSFAQGSPLDERFLVVWGAGVAQGRTAYSIAESIHATVAEVLELQGVATTEGVGT